MKRPKPRIGATTRKMSAILPPMINAMTKEKTSIRGQRMAVRITIM